MGQIQGAINNVIAGGIQTYQNEKIREAIDSRQEEKDKLYNEKVKAQTAQIYNNINLANEKQKATQARLNETAEWQQTKEKEKLKIEQDKNRRANETHELKKEGIKARTAHVNSITPERFKQFEKHSLQSESSFNKRLNESNTRIYEALDALNNRLNAYISGATIDTITGAIDLKTSKAIEGVYKLSGQYKQSLLANYNTKNNIRMTEQKKAITSNVNKGVLNTLSKIGGTNGKK